MNVTTLSDTEYEQFQAFIYAQVGIKLNGDKKTLLVSRLGKRLRQLELSSYQEYLDYVRGEAGHEELTNLLDLVSTNKTDFFREPIHFDFLRQTIIPSLMDRRQIRIWSSASSSGEEPYTIAMTLYDAVQRPDQWDFKVLASDISTRVLAKAAAGIYDDERVSSLDPALVRRHFLRGRGEQSHSIKVKPHIANLVRFRRINLMDETFPIKSALDVVFCRNVMIYFDRDTQSRLVKKFYRYLKPGGYLFIGHSESLQWVDHPFEYVQPTIYQKPEEGLQKP
ncbi:MAG: protein-glutamate O-methyltransferase [Nitrospirales bacterium]|nr:protein-glutamate O-methyltransferase [Nitrospira sp.]MDR4502304.1 protein-glutamate O-methyltransferase [Nitrospirales bacterium]